MQVTVSLKIHLDATASLSEMERQIRAAGQEAMKQALEQAIHQSEEQQKRCPTCGSDQLHTQGTKRRVVVSSFGRVELVLRRYRCQPCQQFFRPADRN